MKSGMSPNARFRKSKKRNSLKFTNEFLIPFATAFFLIVIHVHYVDSLSIPVTCLNKFEKYD